MLNNPHRLAWITLLSALMMFMVMCAAIVGLGRYTLFEWPINLDTTLYVSRGTSGMLRSNDLAELNVRDQVAIDTGDRISTDELAQSSLVFADPFDTDTIIATVQLRANSEIALTSAHRPRFFGDDPYRIVLQDLQGTVEIVVADGLDRDIQLEINGDAGDVRIETPGLYTITSVSTELRVSAERGQALVITQQQGGQLVNEGQIARISSQEQLITDVETVNLVQNSSLTPPPGGGVPLGWGCSSAPESDADPITLGTLEPRSYQGRDTIHIRRLSDVQLFPARSFCKQFFSGDDGQSGLDVTQYDSLRIRVRMHLVQHTLPGCGQAGSECILMVHMRYRNAADPTIVRDYYQGFYIIPADRLGWPNKCASCTSNHLHVNAGAWYTFESTDLVQDLALDLQNLRPVELEFIEFYASGHGYEVFVDEVSVIAEIFDATSEIVTTID